MTRKARWMSDLEVLHDLGNLKIMLPQSAYLNTGSTWRSKLNVTNHYHYVWRSFRRWVATVNYQLANYSLKASNFDAAMRKAFRIELGITVKELAKLKPNTPQHDSRVVYHDWLLKHAARWNQVRRRDDRNRRECRKLKDQDFYHFSKK